MRNVVDDLTYMSYRLEAVGDLIKSEGSNLRDALPSIQYPDQAVQAHQELEALYDDLHEIADSITRIRQSF